jgi:hypothetical protein
MARLLHDVRYPHAVTRGGYLTARRAEDPSSHWWTWANEAWAEIGGEGDQLNPAVPAEDLESLLQAAAPIRKIVNTTIAHASV